VDQILVLVTAHVQTQFPPNITFLSPIPPMCHLGSTHWIDLNKHLESSWEDMGSHSWHESNQLLFKHSATCRHQLLATICSHVSSCLNT